MGLEHIKVVPIQRYGGDQIIARVLKCLGVRSEIENNPRVIEKVSSIVTEIMEKKGIEIEGVRSNWGFLQGECTQEEIDAIVNLLKECQKFTREGINEWFESKIIKESETSYEITSESLKGTLVVDSGRRETYDVYYGISVDKENRSLSIQTLYSFPSCNNKVSTTTFKMGEERGVTEIITSRQEMHNLGEVMGIVKRNIDENGIVMKVTWPEIFTDENGTRIVKRKIRTLTRTSDPILAQSSDGEYHVLDEMYSLPDLLESRINFSSMKSSLLESMPGFNTPEEAMKSKVYKTVKDAVTNTRSQRWPKRYEKGMCSLFKEARIDIGRPGRD